jgi:hypothetical protein
MVAMVTTFFAIVVSRFARQQLIFLYMATHHPPDDEVLQRREPTQKPENPETGVAWPRRRSLAELAR